MEKANRIEISHFIFKLLSVYMATDSSVIKFGDVPRFIIIYCTVYFFIILDSDHFPESLEKQQDSNTIEKRYTILNYRPCPYYITVGQIFVIMENVLVKNCRLLKLEDKRVSQIQSSNPCSILLGNLCRAHKEPLHAWIRSWCSIISPYVHLLKY